MLEEKQYRRWMFMWCLIITILGCYFSVRLVSHEDWSREQGKQILEQLKEIRMIIDKK